MQTAIEPTTTKKTRPRKTEFKVNELSEDAKQEVLDRHRYRDVEDFEWWDCTYTDFEEDAKAKGFEIGTRTVKTTKDKTYQELEIYFSGFCSQGDGASFAGTVDLDKYIRAHLEDLIKAGIDIFTLRKILNNEPSTSDWEAETPIITQGGRYCHENTMDISFNWRGETPPEIDKAFTQMRDFILEDARDLAKELYKKLEAEHDYLTSDEVVIESLNANDEKFTRDGEDI